MAADFRERYGVSVYEAGLSYTYLEAFLLMVGLLKDISTRTGAAYHKLKHPLDRTTEAVAALYNLTLAANTKDDDSRVWYPSPFPEPEPLKISEEELARKRALFAQMNPALLEE